MTTLADRIQRVADEQDFGKASAVKRGRNPRFPYVPIIVHGLDTAGYRTEQLLGKAFVTRAEAVAHAADTIAFRRSELARKLALPRYRALRERHGLPRELTR